jgi:CheY-like chemotaxis protein
MPDTKKKILLVEDEDPSRELMATQLKGAGYAVLETKDGQEAFALAQENVPDLIITDAIMPVLDGAQLFKKIRSTFFGKNIPFMVLSARATMRGSFEAMGADGFMAKPYQVNEFLAQVDRLLSRQQVGKPTEAAKRVLIAGNDSECLDTIMDLLKKEGCHTDCVPFSDQVISKAVMFLPHILIIEAEMPGIPVDENIRILRQMPQFKKIPILIYSFVPEGKVRKEDLHQKEINLAVSVRQCLEKGASEYLGKFLKETFIAQVGKYLKKAEILIIDDDPVLIQLLRVEFTKQDYKVETAFNGPAGLELARKNRPHLILLDLILPEMIGYEVLGKLKSDPLTKDIRVVMMTVKGEDNSIQKALDLGADDYLLKPVHMGLLKKRLQGWLEGAARNT